MILTQCAVCATDLGLTRGKKCGRCSTRYWQHWKEGGHDTLCKKIKRAGGAEQYNANQKYSEAVAVAATACADDTKGQTCYICTQALHWKTKEGLVRRCACRGTAGFAHVSCLAEQAKILVAEALENNLDVNARWTRWYACSLCEQDHHGVVKCALGWACWKTYVGRPEDDVLRMNAMNLLGNGLTDVEHHEEALSVKESELAMKRRLGASAESMLIVQNNLACTYQRLGRLEEALQMKRDVYSGHSRHRDLGPLHQNTLKAALNLSTSLVNAGNYAEARAFTRDQMELARRALGADHPVTLDFQWGYSRAFTLDKGVSAEQLAEVATTLEKTLKVSQRVRGREHPLTRAIRDEFTIAKTKEELVRTGALEGSVEGSVS
jgi:tetratricopeptide (TPR) repeat protein